MRAIIDGVCILEIDVHYRDFACCFRPEVCCVFVSAAGSLLSSGKICFPDECVLVIVVFSFSLVCHSVVHFARTCWDGCCQRRDA